MPTTAATQSPPDDALCLGCGYALRGLGEPRCPECGREFDPGDRWTMNVGRPMPRAAAALAGPLGEWARRGLLISCGAILWGAAWLPGAQYVELLGWCGAAAVVAYTIARRSLGALLRRYYAHPPPGRVRSEQFRPMQVLLVVMAMSSPLFWWPLRVSLLIQQPLLDRFARYAYEDQPMSSPPLAPRMIGGFVVTRIWVSPTTVTLGVLGAGMLQWSPSAPNRQFVWMRSQRIPWYYHWAIPPLSGTWVAAPEDPRGLLRRPQGVFVP